MRALLIISIKFSLPVLSILLQPILAKYLGEHIFIYALGIVFSLLYYSELTIKKKPSPIKSKLSIGTIISVFYFIIWKDEYNLIILNLILGLLFGLSLVAIQGKLIKFIKDYTSA